MQEDTIEECSKSGQVEACVIPQPHPPSEPVTPADEHIGKIFVAFKDLAGAAAAKKTLHGRKFDGKSVVAKVSCPPLLRRVGLLAALEQAACSPIPCPPPVDTPRHATANPPAGAWRLTAPVIPCSPPPPT